MEKNQYKVCLINIRYLYSKNAFLPILNDMLWDYFVSKAPINLPRLNVKSPNEKTLELLLKPVKEIILPSDSESDCSSEIIDAFEEFHKNSFLRPLPGTKRKFLTKQEADWKTVEQFTGDFKAALKEIREEMGLPKKLTLPNEPEIEQELSTNTKNAFFKNTQKPAIEDPISVKSEIVSSEATSNSAIWNMIKAHAKPYFATSPPQYDIYNLNPDHYLKRPHVAWDELEKSRKKCEKWLEECE